MSRKDAIKQLKIAAKIGKEDPEAAHLRADEVLTQLLSSLGYQDVVRKWESVEKYYS